MRALPLLLLLLLAPLSARAETVAGVPRVVDGDSLRFPTTEVRLEGLDAPEMTQHCHRGDPPRPWRCGLVAASELRKLIDGREVTCTGVLQPNGTERDGFGRLLAVCTVGGVEINRWMVAQGLAVNFDRYGMRYKDVEAQAIAAKRGIWAGPFIRPEDWRAARKGGR